MKTFIKFTFYSIFLTSLFYNCNQTIKEKESNTSLSLPDFPWLQNAVIYKINLKQFSLSGNFKGFEERLDSIKNLGIDILWFSTVQPDADLKAVKKELGNLDNFRNLVEKCHEKKFKVIMNWDAQNSSDKTFGNTAIEAMKWWIDECDIDGFYCNIKDGNNKFWQTTAYELNQTKKILLLSNQTINEAFNASDGTEFYELLKEIYKHKKNTDSLITYIKKAENGPLKLNYTSINGEIHGDAQDAFIALTFTINGLPMIYNGMEVGLSNTFEKITINWNQTNSSKQFEFYKTLISIRHKNPALWVNVEGQSNTRVFKNTKEVYGFIRQSGENKVLVVSNLSGNTVKMDALEIPGLEQYSLRLYKNMKTDGEHLYELGPWGYSVSTLNEPTD